MKPDYVAALIEPLDFVKFRELARHCIQLLGYKRPTVSDGWADGGRDIRVYHVQGAKPIPVAFQVSVEWNWKSKLMADLVKAKARLGCVTFHYVTNRRIGDAEFAPLVTKALADHQVNLAKIDSQDIAQQVVDQDQLGWLLDLVGIQVAARPRDRASLRQEVADTFLLFSGDVQEFRVAMVEHALKLVLHYSPGIGLESLLAEAQSALDFPHLEMFRSAVDRLRQRGDIETREGALYLNEALGRGYYEAGRLVAQDWKAFVGQVQEILTQFLPKQRPRVTPNEAALAVAGRIGSVVHAYRDYQAAFMQLSADEKDIRLRYTREVSSVSALIHGFGVPEDRVPECMQALSNLEKDHFSVAKLTAGEVFRKLVPSGSNALLNSLGRATGARMYLESSVMIPMICARLYRTVGGNRFLLAANRLFESASHLSVKFVLSDVYLEECATHLVFAGRYAPIVASGDSKELLYSENAFVAYYAAMGGGQVEFPEFLASFGYRKTNAGFKADILAVEASLGQLVRSYEVDLDEIRRFRASEAIRRVAEQDLDHIYHDEDIRKPGVLVHHDVAVLTFMRETSTRSDEALIMVTWDKSLQEACRMDPYQWWCLDPVHASDILTLANPGGGGSMDLQVALMMDDETLRRAAKIWDELVTIEKDKMFDADLFRKAKHFRNWYLKQQQSDRFVTRQIASAWDHAKQDA